jgi:hypothetical protein
MIADRIHMAFVEAHKLDVWIRDIDTKGGRVLFVVPHAYTLTMDSMSRTQEFRMTVETERVVYTLPDPVQAAEHRFSAGGDDAD